MNRSIWRMECPDVVKVVGDCAHLHHAVPIIRCQALDLGAPGIVVGSATRFSQLSLEASFSTYRFWNHTCTCRGLRPGISRESRSRCAASGWGCFANSLIRKRVCWCVSLDTLHVSLIVTPGLALRNPTGTASSFSSEQYAQPPSVAGRCRPQPLLRLSCPHPPIAHPLLPFAPR